VAVVEKKSLSSEYRIAKKRKEKVDTAPLPRAILTAAAPTILRESMVDGVFPADVGTAWPATVRREKRGRRDSLASAVSATELVHESCRYTMTSQSREEEPPSLQEEQRQSRGCNMVQGRSIWTLLIRRATRCLFWIMTSIVHNTSPLEEA
jgi:hypothetical protein